MIAPSVVLFVGVCGLLFHREIGGGYVLHNKNNRILLQSSQTITKVLAIKFYLVYREPFPLNVGPSS